MSIKDGDYFNYSWKIGRGPSSDSYWCRDRRCVARDDGNGGILIIDTYNYWPFKDGQLNEDIFTLEGLDREYSKYIDTEAFDLEFICNLNDYMFIAEYDKEDYDEVVFVGYQCTKKWAVLKGANKSKTAMIRKFEYKLEQAECDKRSAEWEIEYCKKKIAEIGENE